MKMKKRAISLLLVFAMVTGLFIGISFDVDAEDEENYELYIAGVQVTSAQPSGEGWSYDYANKTLTLDGLNVENNFNGSYIQYDGKRDFKIVLKNTNYIKSNNGAIYANFATLKIEGNGILKVSSEASSYDILCKNLEIANGDVRVFGDKIGKITVTNNMTISGGYVGVTSEHGNCIQVDNNITISGGTVYANGYGYGIYSDMDIEISGGKVVADGENGDGIYSGGNIKISGGEVEAKSEGANGIYSGGNIKISGGTVEAKSYSDNDNYKAVYGLVINNIVGVGFDEATSTQGTRIPIDTTGRTLNYKKVQFPASVAKIKTKPTAKTLTYTGNEQELVTVGVPENGTMKYALGEDDTTAPTDGYDTAIPKGKDAKTYYVWFKAVGDATHLDSDAECVTVKINSEEPDPPTPPTPPGPKPPAPTQSDVLEGGNQVVAYGQPASFEFDIPFDLFQQSGKVYVDGEETDSKNYDSKPGSTIITLKDEFIKTLSEGAHEILVTVEGYEASTSFTVKKADAPNTDNSSNSESGTATPTTTTPTSTTTTSKVTSPKTSDTIPIVAILILALGIGTIGIAAFKNRE